MEDDDDPNGAYNRALIFKGGNYAYWKENMVIHLLSVDKIYGYPSPNDLIPKGNDNVVKHPKD